MYALVKWALFFLWKMRLLQHLVQKLAQIGAFCANYKKVYVAASFTHTHKTHTVNEQAKPTPKCSRFIFLLPCSMLSPSTFSLSLTVGVSTSGRWLSLSLSRTHSSHSKRAKPTQHSLSAFSLFSWVIRACQLN